jgi:hypothetical protein
VESPYAHFSNCRGQTDDVVIRFEQVELPRSHGEGFVSITNTAGWQPGGRDGLMGRRRRGVDDEGLTTNRSWSQKCNKSFARGYMEMAKRCSLRPILISLRYVV